ncbi:isoprenylcysteine carboxylmethyltransferase family protein [Polaromonas sp.]|uniref:methyltransferase family protein n=1 Tax=Polaromonas sp. TaxID=1869339 RepID=UPI00356B3328
MTTFELKIPPPAVALVIALLMWLTSFLFGSIPIPLVYRLSAALVLLVIGQGISISGIVSFRRARTTLNPFKPATSSALVTGGIFSFTRNPMYLGLLLTLLGWAAFLASPPTLVFLFLYVVYINRFQIDPEERVLSSIFGDGYAAYKTRVRRWV